MTRKTILTPQEDVVLAWMLREVNTHIQGAAIQANAYVHGADLLMTEAKKYRGQQHLQPIVEMIETSVELLITTAMHIIGRAEMLIAENQGDILASLGITHLLSPDLEALIDELTSAVPIGEDRSELDEATLTLTRLNLYHAIDFPDLTNHFETRRNEALQTIKHLDQKYLR